MRRSPELINSGHKWVQVYDCRLLWACEKCGWKTAMVHPFDIPKSTMTVGSGDLTCEDAIIVSVLND